MGEHKKENLVFQMLCWVVEKGFLLAIVVHTLTPVLRDRGRWIFESFLMRLCSQQSKTNKAKFPQTYVMTIALEQGHNQVGDFERIDIWQPHKCCFFF